MSCCAKQPTPLTKPLLKEDQNGYGSSKATSNEAQLQMPAFSESASLLDPSGQLSSELMSVLDELFMRHSLESSLVMDKQSLVALYRRFYPNLSAAETYGDRADYILAKYGKQFSAVTKQLRMALDARKEESTSKVQIVDVYSSRRRQTDLENMEETKYSEAEAAAASASASAAESEAVSVASTKHGHHRMAIFEEESVVSATLAVSVEPSTAVLSKTKFLLLYRKQCVDKPMMVRLELTECGYEQFRSGMVVDRSKNMDKLAFNIQQLRNRERVHRKEQLRIQNALDPKECALSIESFIKESKEPLDGDADNNNLFRKRRPIKFPKVCHACCCCIVCAVRACE